MVIGEAGAVRGDQPQAHAEKSPSAGSLKAFSEALGAPIEVQSRASSDPDFNFVEAAPKDRYSQFPSSAEFKKELILPALLESSTGLSTATWAGPFATFGLGESFGTNLINRGKGEIDGGSNPVSITGTAATDTFGERVAEKIRNSSNVTGADLKLTTGERMTGGVFDLVGGFSNGTGAREFAKAPGVGEPSVSRRSSTEPAVNDTPTSAQRQFSTRSTGADDTAANGGTAAATAGRDAGDSIRVRRAGSGEGYRPSDATDISESKTGQFTRDIPDRGNTAKMRKTDGADAAKVESISASGSGAKAGADAAVPSISVDQIIDAYVKGRSPAEIGNSVVERDTARMKEEYKDERRRNGHAPEIADRISEDQYRHMAMAGDIYHHDNQLVVGKPQPTITEAQLNAQLKTYDGPTEAMDGWHVRTNKSPAGTPANHSWVNADQPHSVDRFHVNVTADHALEFADDVSGEVNKKGIKLQHEVASEIDGYVRADSGLVYTPGHDFEAVRDVIAIYRDLHPEAIADGSPALTKPMGKGISVAEVLLQDGLPIVHHGTHSFGTAWVNGSAEAITRPPSRASVEHIGVLVRARLQGASFDPDRSWLAQGSKVHRLSDVNVARNNAANGGATVDDRMPLPAVEANPPALSREQGDAAGYQGASGDAEDGSNGSGGDQREQRRHREPESSESEEVEL